MYVESIMYQKHLYGDGIRDMMEQKRVKKIKVIDPKGDILMNIQKKKKG